MRRCSSARGTYLCSCGMYHSQSGAPFCVVLSMSNGGECGGLDEEEMVYAFDTTSSSSSASSSSSVDCTLSLGTPSTRLAIPDESASRQSSYFGWNKLHAASKHAPPPPTRAAKSHPAGDSLLARRCANCDTTSTPLWRNGPRGPKSLCNACGIRFKKEERRATAAASATTNGGDAQQMMAWTSRPQKPPAHELRYINDVVEDRRRDSDGGGGGGGGIPFLSWRFNRPAGLVHDFTR